MAELSIKLQQFWGRYFSGSSRVRCVTRRAKRSASWWTHSQPSWPTIVIVGSSPAVRTNKEGSTPKSMDNLSNQRLHECTRTS